MCLDASSEKKAQMGTFIAHKHTLPGLCIWGKKGRAPLQVVVHNQHMRNGPRPLHGKLSRSTKDDV